MINNKIKASFLMGAIGDALGAPIEGIRKLSDITDIYGHNGLSDLVPYTSHFEDKKEFPAGSITDDTTMAMTTALALTRAMAEYPTTHPLFEKKLKYYTWQGYINWAKPQVLYPKDVDLIDKNLQWDSLAHKFWWACGAGKGTLAALSQNQLGSIDKPVVYDLEIDGKKLQSPNNGCGGMMRIAPLAFVETWSDDKLFTQSCENAALTHGAPEAYVATGMTALLVRYAAEGYDHSHAMFKAQSVLINHSFDDKYKDGVRKVVDAVNYVSSLKSEFNLESIDQIPQQLGYKNPFLAVPVMAQTVFALNYAEESKDVKQAMILSANHSGDSDSVAAIVGNVLGARYGDAGVVKEWYSKLAMKSEILQVASRVQSTCGLRR